MKNAIRCTAVIALAVLTGFLVVSCNNDDVDQSATLKIINENAATITMVDVTYDWQKINNYGSVSSNTERSFSVPVSSSQDYHSWTLTLYGTGGFIHQSHIPLARRRTTVVIYDSAGTVIWHNP
jgi:hypothetical protein